MYFKAPPVSSVEAARITVQMSYLCERTWDIPRMSLHGEYQYMALRLTCHGESVVTIITSLTYGENPQVGSLNDFLKRAFTTYTCEQRSS